MQSNEQDKGISRDAQGDRQDSELPLVAGVSQSSSPASGNLMKRVEGSQAPASIDPGTTSAKLGATTRAESQPTAADGGDGRKPPSVTTAPPMAPPEDEEPSRPAFDVEAFATEALEDARGAKTINEVLRISNEILRLIELKVPMSRIHAGLVQRKLISSKKTRFEAIVREKLTKRMPPKRQIEG